jgi:hypothetical protein
MKLRRINKMQIYACILIFMFTSLSATIAGENVKLKDIGGYDGLNLGGNMEDLRSYVGNDVPIDNGLYIFDAPIWEEWTNSATENQWVTVSVSIDQHTINGLLIEPKNLQEDYSQLEYLASYVGILREIIRASYDEELIIEENFKWYYDLDGEGMYGTLLLKDEDGDCVSLIWDGWTVYFIYATAEFIDDFGLSYDAFQGC